MVDIQEVTSNKDAGAHTMPPKDTSPPNVTLSQLVTDIHLLKDSNNVITGLLERVLQQQDDIIRSRLLFNIHGRLCGL